MFQQNLPRLANTEDVYSVKMKKTLAVTFWASDRSERDPFKFTVDRTGLLDRLKTELASAFVVQSWLTRSLRTFFKAFGSYSVLAKTGSFCSMLMCFEILSSYRSE